MPGRRIELSLPFDIPKDPKEWHTLTDGLVSLWMESGRPPLNGRLSLGFQWTVSGETLTLAATWEKLSACISAAFRQMQATTSPLSMLGKISMGPSQITLSTFGEAKLTVVLEEV